jgi:uncharacterized GH25 family protein
MKKILLTIAATIAITTSAQAKDVVLEDKRMSSHDMCVLQAGYTISSLKDKGAKAVKVVDSAHEQMFVYKIQVGANSGFVTCTGKQYKVWVMK